MADNNFSLQSAIDIFDLNIVESNSLNSFYFGYKWSVGSAHPTFLTTCGESLSTVNCLRFQVLSNL